MGKSGIYIIKNNSNNKVYVGQSKNVKNRVYVHRYSLQYNRHYNKHLQTAWNRDGEPSFIFEIIEICPKEKLDEREIYYINMYDSYVHGYNGTTGGQVGHLVDPNRIKLNEQERTRAHRNGALKSLATRKATKGKCRECGAETENGFIRYCEKHTEKCKKCSKRFKKINSEYLCPDCKIYKTPESKITCTTCGTSYKRKSNNQKNCPKCSREIRKNKQKMYMRERRKLERF